MYSLFIIYKKITRRFFWVKKFIDINMKKQCHFNTMFTSKALNNCTKRPLSVFSFLLNIATLIIWRNTLWHVPSMLLWVWLAASKTWEHCGSMGFHGIGGYRGSGGSRYTSMIQLLDNKLYQKKQQQYYEWPQTPETILSLNHCHWY